MKFAEVVTHTNDPDFEETLFFALCERTLRFTISEIWNNLLIWKNEVFV